MYPKEIKYNVTYSAFKKRKAIDETLKELHETQLNMIDEAVGYSDMQQAKDIINYIRSL
jgi:hypothetical protein